MLEPTRKPRIDVFRITCPTDKADRIKAYLAKQGCEIEPSVNPEDILPHESPATFLAGARYRESMTQQTLSEKTGIPRRHISEMETEKPLASN